MRYYAEEIRFDGTRKCVIYEQKPSERTSDGAKRRFLVPPVEMNAGHDDLTINQARKRYAPDRQFRNC